MEFFIRGVTTFGYSKSPLILIDNIESSTTDLSRLSADDIAAFSIMKDATATAIYGARGANGVILITTKQGKPGKVKLVPEWKVHCQHLQKNRHGRSYQLYEIPQ